MTSERLSNLLLAAAGAVTVSIGAAANAAAADAEFYRGKTVVYVVATGAGGGFDFYGRLVAEYMQKYLPGSTFVVKNMPGAGHMIGAQAVYNAKPDGLTIGTFNTSLIYNQLVDRETFKLDFTKLSWIGKAAADPRVFIISTTSPIKSFPELQKSGTVNFASGGVGGGGYIESRVLIDALKLPVKLLAGYNGNEDQMAMRRGEITGAVGSRSSSDDFIKAGYGRYIAQIGGNDKDVPQLSTFVEAPEAKALVALIQSQGDISRLTAGPGGIAAGRLDALRAAYKTAMEDKELQAKAIKGGRPVEPAYGEDVARMIRAALNQPPQTVAMLRDALNAKPAAMTSSGPLVDVIEQGRKIVVNGSDGKPVTLEPSGSRTKMTIAGKDAKREDLKKGLNCEVTYVPGSVEPNAIACR